MPTTNISNGFRGDKVLGDYWGSDAPKELNAPNLLMIHAIKSMDP